MNNEKINRLIYNKISEDINNFKSINENNKLLSEGVADVLQKYMKKGLLTASVISMLLSNNIINAQDLKNANISDYQKTEQQFQTIEDALIRKLDRQQKKGMLEIYKSLTQDEKNETLKYIQSKIKNISDVGDYTYHFNIHNNPEKKIIPSYMHRISGVVETINVVDTIFHTPNINNYFENKSLKLNDADDLKTTITGIIENFQNISKIEIITSSNTLRNTGALEGLTWLEVSKNRGEIIRNLISSINKPQLNNVSFTLDYYGENGDGTSGNKSPYEVDDEYIKSYKARGIDSSLWKSKSTSDKLENISEYNQFNSLIIKIYGVVCESNDVDKITYKDLSMTKPQNKSRWNGIYFKKGSKSKSIKPHKGVIPCLNN